MLAARVHLPPLFAAALLSPSPSFGPAQCDHLRRFFCCLWRARSRFSQGDGPDTIAEQLRSGASADVVIMSKEGLGELIAEGRIIPASAVDLAEVRLGVAVRAGAPKPDISTVEAFRHMLLRSKSINALSRDDDLGSNYAD
jgi:Bacterial extracellular solute-binding protein